MPAVRLVFLVALVVGVLAAISASTSMTRDPEGTTGSTAPSGAAAPVGREVDAAVPRKGPLVVRVGDDVRLTVTLDEAARVVIDELGVEEDVGAGVPILVPFTATAAGTYHLRDQTTGRSVLRVIVRPARPAAGSGGSGGSGSGGSGSGGSGGTPPDAVRTDEPRLV